MKIEGGNKMNEQNLFDRLMDYDYIENQFNDSILADERYEKVWTNIDEVHSKIVKEHGKYKKQKLLDELFDYQSELIGVYREYDIRFAFAAGLIIANSTKILSDDNFKNDLINTVNSLLKKEDD